MEIEKIFKYEWPFKKKLTDTKSQNQKIQRTTCRENTNKSTPRYIIPKLQKIKGKEKVLKEDKNGKKNLTYKRTIKITEDFHQKPCKQEQKEVKCLKS